MLCAFDLIELDGADLRRAPIEHHKHKLSQLVRTPHPGIVLNDHCDGDEKAFSSTPANSAVRVLYRNGSARFIAPGARRIG